MDGRKLVAIGENAVRLSQDARLLFNAKRFPTSFALSIASLEESGKLFHIRWDVPDKMNRMHIRKQLGGATFFAEALISEWTEELKKAGYSIEKWRELSEERRKRYEAIEEEEDILEWPPGVFDRVYDNLQRKGIFEDYAAVGTGEINLLKQLALYEDPEGSRDRSIFTQGFVEPWLSRAESTSALVLSISSREASVLDLGPESATRAARSLPEVKD